MKSLSINDTFALESLLTTALYIPLITGHLDPKSQRVHVTSVLPLRDLSPGTIPTLQRTLLAWSQNCSDALAELEKQAEVVKQNARAREEQNKRREKAVEKAAEKEEALAQGKTTGKRGATGEEDTEGEAMEGVEAGLSRDGNRPITRSAKKSGFGGLVSRRLG